MNARVWLNTSSAAWTETVDGGSFAPPALRAYTDLIVRFRLAREIEGTAVPDPRPVDSVAMRIGRQDVTPESGTYTLDLTLGSDTVTTAAIAYNADAAAVQTAINNALDSSALDALHPCTVALVGGDYRIVFADTDETVDVVAETNLLWPASFINADRIEWGGGWATILNLRQTPVAESVLVEETVAPEPVVTRIQAGSETDGVAINEVQKIALSPDYAGGTWRIVRDGTKGALLPGFPTVEQLQDALDGLALTGEEIVLLAVEDGVLVEFRGTSSGIGQELLEVEEFTPPPSEWLVKLSTRTAEMRTLMRGADSNGEIETQLDLHVVVDDAEAPGGTQEMNFPLTLTFSRPVSDDSLNASASVDWSQPLSRTSNLDFSTDATLVGSRARRFTIGDGVATSFALQHNLGAASANFTADAGTNACTSAGHALVNGDPIVVSSSGTLPGGLTAGVTYWVIAATTNTFQLALTVSGSAIDLSSAGSGTHAFSVADGTVDAVHVEVWQTGGSKLRISPEDYTVAKTSSDVVTVSGFSVTPTAGQYEVVVTSAGRPATYQAHHHPVAEITGLQAIIDGIYSRLDGLENGEFSGPAPAAPSISGTIDRALPTVWSVPRARTRPAAPETLVDWNPFAEGSTLRDLRLLPAVHVADGSLEVLPGVLPTPAASYRDRVFYSPSARPEFPGGLLAGQYAACDGREWYRVRRESDDETTWYPTAFEIELFRLSISPDELALRTRLDLSFGIELALFDPARRPLDRRTVARMALILERGVRVADASPATTGSNIDAHFGSAVVLARHDFDLTSVPVQKRMALGVARSGADVVTATVSKFLAAASPVSPPASADFAIRARLARFDVEDLPEDGRGILAVRGPGIALDGSADPTLGRWTIGT